MNYEISWEIDESDSNLDPKGQAAFVPGVTHIQGLDGMQRHPQKMHPKPTHLKKQERKKPLITHQYPSNQDDASREDQLVSLKHLRPEDKKRIANLIRQLAKVGEEKQVAVQQLNVERKQFEVKYVDLGTQLKTLTSDRETIQEQYFQCQRLLAECQERLANEQNQHTDLLKFAQKGLRNERKSSGRDKRYQSISDQGGVSNVEKQFQPQLQSTVRLKRDQDRHTSTDFHTSSYLGHQQTTQMRSNDSGSVYSNHATSDPPIQHRVPNHQDFGRVQRAQGNKDPLRGRGGGIGLDGSEKREPNQFGPLMFSPDEFLPLPEELMTTKSLNALGNMEDEFSSLAERHPGRIEPPRYYSGPHPTEGEVGENNERLIPLSDTTYQRFTTQHSHHRGNFNQTQSNGYQMDLSSHGTHDQSQTVARPSKRDECGRASHETRKSTPEMLVERKRLLEKQKVELKREQDWLQQQLKNQEDLLYQKQLELEAHRKSLLVGSMPPADEEGVSMHTQRRRNVDMDFKSGNREYDVSLAAHREPIIERMRSGVGLYRSMNRENLSHQSNHGDELGIHGMQNHGTSHTSTGQIQGSVTLHSDSLHEQHHLCKTDPFSNATVDAATSPLKKSELRQVRRNLTASPAIHHPRSGLCRETSSVNFSPDEFVVSPEKIVFSNSTRRRDSSNFLEDLIGELNSITSDNSDGHSRPLPHHIASIESHHHSHRTPVEQTTQLAFDRLRIPVASLPSRLYGSEVAESFDEEDESRILDEIFFVN